MRSVLSFFLVSITFLTIACSQEPTAPTQPATLSGQIDIAADLKGQVDPNAVLYIIASKEVGPPLAVRKVDQPQFPVQYSLSQVDAMMPGMIFQGEVKISARLDKDGNAGPLTSGDMTGALAKTVPVGKSDVNITIDTLIP